MPLRIFGPLSGLCAPRKVPARPALGPVPVPGSLSTAGRLLAARGFGYDAPPLS
jgi:hypothetical protein